MTANTFGHAAERRRRIATIASVLAAEFAVLGMRQYGAIRHLPDVPLRGFDANAVTTASSAYPLGIPDSALAVSGLGVIIGLASARGTVRARYGRWLDGVLVVATGLGACGAVYYLDDMLRKQRRICIYCVAGAVGFFTMFVSATRVCTRGRDP